MRVISFLVAFTAISAPLARSQSAIGVIQGIVSTQSGTVKLPGVEITVKDASAREVSQVLCGEDGSFRVELPPGIYRVVASLPGFVTTTRTAVVVAGKTFELPIDLPIEGIAQTIDVVATNPVVRGDGMLSPIETIGSREMEQFAPSGGLQASLRLLASIIEVPGGVSIKGGRPSQAGVQLGPSSLVDTATGLNQMSLPDDAVDSVDVLPNPYAVEYGRFSSGLVVIQTRRAGDEWKVRLNNLDPSFRTKRGSPVNLYGVQWWAPRLEVGGPIIKDRLFIEQTAQYRYRASDVPSLPPELLRTSHSFSSFTRIDANLSPRQTLVASGGIFPGVSNQDTLGTFTPPQATIDLHAKANEIALTERALWTDALFSETTVHAHAYETDVKPQGLAPMALQPETTLGNFFNQQHRHTTTYQLIETLSGTRKGGQCCPPWRVRPVLRANAVDRRRVRSVRSRRGQAFRERRCYAARSARSVPAHHGRSRDAAQPDVGHRLRPSPQQSLVVSPQRRRSTRHPRAGARSPADRGGWRAASLRVRAIELSGRRGRRALHAWTRR